MSINALPLGAGLFLETAEKKGRSLLLAKADNKSALVQAKEGEKIPEEGYCFQKKDGTIVINIKINDKSRLFFLDPIKYIGAPSRVFDENNVEVGTYTLEKIAINNASANKYLFFNISFGPTHTSSDGEVNAHASVSEGVFGALSSNGKVSLAVNTALYTPISEKRLITKAWLGTFEGNDCLDWTVANIISRLADMKMLYSLVEQALPFTDSPHDARSDGAYHVLEAALFNQNISNKDIDRYLKILLDAERKSSTKKWIDILWGTALHYLLDLVKNSNSHNVIDKIVDFYAPLAQKGDRLAAKILSELETSKENKQKIAKDLAPKVFQSLVDYFIKTKDSQPAVSMLKKGGAHNISNDVFFEQLDNFKSDPKTMLDIAYAYFFTKGNQWIFSSEEIGKLEPYVWPLVKDNYSVFLTSPQRKHFLKVYMYRCEDNGSLADYRKYIDKFFEYLASPKYLKDSLAEETLERLIHWGSWTALQELEAEKNLSKLTKHGSGVVREKALKLLKAYKKRNAYETLRELSAWRGSCSEEEIELKELSNVLNVLIGPSKQRSYRVLLNYMKAAASSDMPLTTKELDIIGYFMLKNRENISADDFNEGAHDILKSILQNPKSGQRLVADLRQKLPKTFNGYVVDSEKFQRFCSQDTLGYTFLNPNAAKAEVQSTFNKLVSELNTGDANCVLSGLYLAIDHKEITASYQKRLALELEKVIRSPVRSEEQKKGAIARLEAIGTLKGLPPSLSNMIAGILSNLLEQKEFKKYRQEIASALEAIKESQEVAKKHLASLEHYQKFSRFEGKTNPYFTAETILYDLESAYPLQREKAASQAKYILLREMPKDSPLEKGLEVPVITIEPKTNIKKFIGRLALAALDSDQPTQDEAGFSLGVFSFAAEHQTFLALPRTQNGEVIIPNELAQDKEARRKYLEHAIFEKMHIIPLDHKRKFKPHELRIIANGFNAMPYHLLAGIMAVVADRFDPDRDYGSAVVVDKIIKFKKDVSLPTFFHETGHTILKYVLTQKQKEYFMKLHKESKGNPKNYATKYAQEDIDEDFAEVCEAWGTDSDAILEKAVQNAQEGYPLLLEKLLFAASLFSDEKGITYGFKVAGPLDVGKIKYPSQKAEFGLKKIGSYDFELLASGRIFSINGKPITVKNGQE